MKFRSAKDWLFGVPMLGIPLFILWYVARNWIEQGFRLGFPHIFTLLSVVLILWIWFDTLYMIKEGMLIYRSGPIRGKIPVIDIRQLIVNKTLWNGLKPALARKGIIVKYNRWDELYISPRDKDAFIAALLAVNDRIEVLENKAMPVRSKAEP